MPRIELTLGEEVIASCDVPEEVFAYLQNNPAAVQMLVREVVEQAGQLLTRDMDHRFITGLWPDRGKG